MLYLSSGVGRSIKKISSNLPLRKSSGARLSILFAVATTKTGFFLSCIHVNIVEKTREFVPPSRSPPAVLNPFSISSIHKTQGAIASAVDRA